MDSWWMRMFSMAFALFLLMDPIGNVPIYVSVLKDIEPKRHRKIITRELIIALVIIVLFYFLGDALLGFLNVTMPTILISGGIILFLDRPQNDFPRTERHRCRASQRQRAFHCASGHPSCRRPCSLGRSHALFRPT